MQDNTAQNPLNNQAPIAPSVPQTSDFPPLPTSVQMPSAPVTPTTTSTQPTTEPMPVIPTVSLETPKKKSSLVMISVVLLIVAIIAGVAYFFGSTYLNKKVVVEPTPTPIESGQVETVEPADVVPQTMVDPVPTQMPASDSPDLIPTIPEASPSSSAMP